MGRSLPHGGQPYSEWFERLAVVIAGEQVVRCIPWTPPTGKLDAAQTVHVIEAVEKGTQHGPYSPILSNTDRSLGPVLAALGITTVSAQRRVLSNLMRSGKIIKSHWRVPGKGESTRIGLRSDKRLPYNWKWQDEAEADDGETS